MTKEISDDDHVTRYCKGNHIGTDGIPLPAAFELRDTDKYLSVNWLEYFGTSDVEENLTHVRKEFIKHHSIATNARFAILNVKEIKSTIKKEFEIMLSIQDLQEEDNPSHASIEGYTNDEDVLNTLSSIIEKDDMYPGRI